MTPVVGTDLTADLTVGLGALKGRLYVVGWRPYILVWRRPAF